MSGGEGEGAGADPATTAVRRVVPAPSGAPSPAPGRPEGNRRPIRLPGSPWDSPLDRPVPRGRHGYALDEVGLYQRVRLLDAFVREVSCRGFPAAQVSQICGLAGTSTKAFYMAFGSKDECLLRAFDVGAAVVCHQGVLAYHRAEGSWPARATAAVHRMLAILGENPPFARLAFVEILRLGPDGAARIEATAAHCLRRIGVQRYRALLPGLDPDAQLAALVAAGVRLLGGYAAAGRAEHLVDVAATLSDWLVAWCDGPDGATTPVEVPG